MKKTLIVVIVLLLGLCGWIRYTSTRPSEAHRVVISGLKGELRESRAEFDLSRQELAAAKADLETLKRRLASLEQSAVERSFSAPESPAQVAQVATGGSPAPPSVSASSSPKAGPLESRLSELQVTFETHRLDIQNRQNLIGGELESLKSRRNLVENTELHFSEQSVMTDVDGSVLGNRGVRTSSADRTRARSKINEKVAEVDLEIAKKQTELNLVFEEMEALRDNYNKAILRAGEELGVKGASGSAK
jgi:uncharacterized coiled-coil protein SlyX